MTTRRKLLVALGLGALAPPFASFAQQPATKVARIGFLGVTSAAEYASRVEALRAGLRDYGYVEGRNLVIEFRWAEGQHDRLPNLAAELVRLKPDVLVTHAVPGTRAAKQATTTIPIVSAAVIDPVALGFVASLARPGGNITGSTFFYAEIVTKRLELLKEALPRVTQVAVLVNPDSPAVGAVFNAMQLTAKSMKVALEKFDARQAVDFEGAFRAMAKSRVGAFIAVEDPLFFSHAKVIAELAAKQRLPSVGFNELAEAGGLIGYAPDFLQLWRRTAYFVDKILKGAKPGDLPIERPTRFELVVNQNTAKALGLTIPKTVLFRADRVIE